jgi:hypothetical protein
MRRALSIDEKSYGPEHPTVASDLNNLAQLLKDTNRLKEAEPLMRRALVILLKFTRASGQPHPRVSDALANYTSLMETLSLTPEQVDLNLEEAGKEAGFDAEALRKLV